MINEKSLFVHFGTFQKNKYSGGVVLLFSLRWRVGNSSLA